MNISEVLLRIRFSARFSIKMAARYSEVEEWKKFAKGIKDKRAKRNEPVGDKKGKECAEGVVLNSREIIVQPLESEASGKAKKYERTGPQEFVEFIGEEVTIETLEESCNIHFREKMPVGSRYLRTGCEKFSAYFSIF